MIHTDTIAAIATAMGNSGIGIVRISGQEAVAVADRIFKEKGKQETLESQKRSFGNLERKSFLRRRAIRSITDIFMTGTRWWTRSW